MLNIATHREYWCKFIVDSLGDSGGNFTLQKKDSIRKTDPFFVVVLTVYGKYECYFCAFSNSIFVMIPLNNNNNSTNNNV